jgi:glycosyltransferase involved in cell wall biosynthesis
MNRVMLVANGFPPEGGGGNIRVTKLAKYLPLFEWTPLVLTAQPPSLSGSIDHTLDSHVTVYRAPRCDITVWLFSYKNWFLRIIRSLRRVEPGAARRVATSLAGERVVARRRWSEYFLLPDDRVFWVPGAVLLGLWAGLKHKPRVLYATSPNPTALIVGYCLSRLLGVPWIAEFRDPWTFNPFHHPRPFRWLERLELLMERLVLTGANHIVVTSPQYKRDLLARHDNLMESDITYIPNGFDPDDFKHARAFRFEKFAILHAGNFYGPRSSRPFLVALKGVLDKQPDLRPAIQVVFLGVQDADTARALKEFGLNDVVNQVSTVSHAQSVEYILGADVLLLIPGPGDGTMPGKMFEYLAARKPVLAIADRGIVQEFIESSGIGTVTAVDDAEGTKAALTNLIGKVMNGTNLYPDISALYRRFDRQHLAGCIAKILDAVGTSARDHSSHDS